MCVCVNVTLRCKQHREQAPPNPIIPEHILKNLSFRGLHLALKQPSLLGIPLLSDWTPPGRPTSARSRLPASSRLHTYRYEVCFRKASPLNFSSRLSCSMSGRLLNVSLQQPAAASSEPAADSESPPSAPSEARRPLKPSVPGLVRSFAWGSMLVDPGSLARRWTPVSLSGFWVDGDAGVGRED